MSQEFEAGLVAKDKLGERLMVILINRTKGNNIEEKDHHWGINLALMVPCVG